MQDHYLCLPVCVASNRSRPLAQGQLVKRNGISVQFIKLATNVSKYVEASDPIQAKSWIEFHSRGRSGLAA